MKSPITLGYVAIMYAVVLFFYPGGIEAIQVVLYMFAAPFLAWSASALVLSYLGGGVALCFRRRWASLAILLTAICQLILYVCASAILYALDRDLWNAILLSTSIVKSLVTLVPPLPIAYLAWRLRREPDAWTRDGEAGDLAWAAPRFYRHKAFWGVITVGAALVWLGNLKPDRRISVAGTPLCYPVEYAVHADHFDSLFAGLHGSYVDVDWETMYIPDRLLADRIPGYTYDERDSFILYGAIFTRERFDPVANAEGIWTIRAEGKPHFIEAEVGFEGYRVYPWYDRTPDWHLVSTPPPEDPQPGPDADWYVGHCVARDRCEVYFQYENFGYRHAIQYRNLHLRSQIKSAIYDILEEWSLACAR